MAKGNTVRLWRRSLIVLMVMLIAGFGLLIFRLVQRQMCIRDREQPCRRER